MMSLKNMVLGLENDAPAKQLIEHWDHDVDSLKFWRVSSNYVYVFDRNGKRYFLRFIHEEDNTIEKIEVELDFMQYLKERGYPTVASVLSKNGRLVETIQTKLGQYYGVVFEQSRGTGTPMEEMSDHHFYNWGMSLGSLHQLSEAYTPITSSRKCWTDALDVIENVLQRYPKEVGLRQALDRLRHQLSELPTGKGQTGLIHYDFELDNLFYDAEEAQYCAIDFDDMMEHWYMMDITTAISDLLDQDGEEAGQQIRHFLAGYRTAKYLDESYLNLVSVFQRFADLYTFERLIRSVEDLDIPTAPEWLIQLKDKLLGVCNQIRKRYQPVTT